MSTAPAKENAVISTSYGDLTIAFWPEVAPKTVENFKKLAREPGYKLKAEFNAKSHQRGVISMARAADPDSAGCQFFICHGNASFLDRQYTAFGQLVGGDDVLERIASVPTRAGGGGERSTPVDRIEVTKVTIVPAAS